MNTLNNKVSKIIEYFNVYLDLERKPVGIRFIYSQADYIKSKFKKYDKRIPYCTMIRNCALDNNYILDIDNFSCMAAATFFGMSNPTQEFTSGQRYVNLKVYQDLEVSKNIVDQMSFMDKSVVAVEIGSLNHFLEMPDVIIVVANAYNVMRIVQANSYHNGYTTRNKMLGMCALCHECTAYPYLNDEINISMMCSGTRCVAQWKDDELSVGIPTSKILDLIEGLRITSNLMDPNTKKKKVAQKLKDSTELKDEEVVYNKNYYTNVYLKNK